MRELAERQQCRKLGVMRLGRFEGTDDDLQIVVPRVDHGPQRLVARYRIGGEDAVLLVPREDPADIDTGLLDEELPHPPDRGVDFRPGFGPEAPTYLVVESIGGQARKHPSGYITAADVGEGPVFGNTFQGIHLSSPDGNCETMKNTSSRRRRIEIHRIDLESEPACSKTAS